MKRARSVVVAQDGPRHSAPIGARPRPFSPDARPLALGAERSREVPAQIGGMNARPLPWKRCLAVVALAALVPLLLAAVTPSNHAIDEAQAREVQRVARDLIRKGAPRTRWGVYARAFAAYALVNVQRSGGEAVDPAPYDALVAQVASPEASSAFPGSVEIAGHRLASSVALRGHLALMLEARDRLGPLSSELARFRDALTGSLAREVLSAPGHLLATEPGVIYPADNEVLLAALSLAAPRKDQTVVAAARSLRSALDALSAKGVAPSRLDGTTLAATDVPRGCALGYSAVFRAISARPAGAGTVRRFPRRLLRRARSPGRLSRVARRR